MLRAIYYREGPEAVGCLRKALTTMTDRALLIALTATADCDLLDIVKGPDAASLNDKGFLSYYHKAGAKFASIIV